MADLPEIILKNWYTFDRDVESIWNLNLPVRTLPMSELVRHLDVPAWPNEDGRKYPVTPRRSSSILTSILRRPFVYGYSEEMDRLSLQYVCVHDMFLHEAGGYR